MSPHSSPLGWSRQDGQAIPGIPDQPMGLDGEREGSWVHSAGAAPVLGIVTLHLLGFDVEVFPQRDVPDGFASANGEHQRHHVRVEACERQETPTGMLQAIRTTEVA